MTERMPGGRPHPRAWFFVLSWLLPGLVLMAAPPAPLPATHNSSPIGTSPSSSSPSSPSPSPSQVPPLDLLGERVYLKGIDVTGQPIQATVVGDLPVSGESFACSRCHLRSGFGASEGSVVVRPITASRLFLPLFQAATQNLIPNLPPSFQQKPLRPAYTDETLARAIRQGLDPQGLLLHPMMPHYQLDDATLRALLAHLRTLSGTPSPAANDTTLHLATVIGPDLPPDAVSAMQSTLEALVTDHNGESRSQQRRGKTGAFYMRAMTAGYRRWELMTWRLTGPSDSWQAQLEHFQRTSPAFALIGGMVPGSWQPIQTFCEKARLPALFPLTTLPGSPDGWYTLYLSMGYEGEGPRLARLLEREKQENPNLGEPHTVQVVDETLAGQALARGAARAWQAARLPLDTWQYAPEAPPGSPNARKLLQERLRQLPAETTVLLWLNSPTALALLDGLEIPRGTQRRYVLSGLRLTQPDPAALTPNGPAPGTSATHPTPMAAPISLPANALPLLPSLPSLPLQNRMRTRVLVTWPFVLPDDALSRQTVLHTWLQNHRLPLDHGLLRMQLFAAVRLLDTGLKMMRENLYPDYLLDRIDMMPDETAAISPMYRQSYGPGQRFASKGCYLLSYADQKARALTPWRGTGWIW